MSDATTQDTPPHLWPETASRRRFLGFVAAALLAAGQSLNRSRTNRYGM